MVRLAVSELTTFRWSFEEDVAQYVAAGIAFSLLNNMCYNISALCSYWRILASTDLQAVEL